MIAAATLGERLRSDLAPRSTSVPASATSAGLGLMIGSSWSATPTRRSRSRARERVTERVLAAAREAGLLLYPSTGHADGTTAT